MWSTGHTYEVLGLAPPAGQPVVRTRDAGLPVTVRVTAIKTGFVPARCTATSSWSRKLKTTTTAALEAKKVPKRGHGVLRIHVDVLGLGVPLGKVQVKKGSNVLATVTVKNDSGGDLTIRLKKLAPGKHKLKVFYFGSTATESSKARKLVLTVLKK